MTTSDSERPGTAVSLALPLKAQLARLALWILDSDGWRKWIFSGGLVALITAIGGVIGPPIAGEISKAVEKQKMQTELAKQVLDTTKNLDPSSLTSVLRFGVVARMVGDNQKVFNLDLRGASERLDALVTELQKGSVGRLTAAEARQQQLVEELERERQRLRDRFEHKSTDGKQAPAGTPGPAVRDLDARYGELIAEMRRTRDEIASQRVRLLDDIGHALTDTNGSLLNKLDEAHAKLAELAKRDARSQRELGQTVGTLEATRHYLAQVEGALGNTRDQMEQQAHKLHDLGVERDQLGQELASARARMAARDDEMRVLREAYQSLKQPVNVTIDANAVVVSFDPVGGTRVGAALFARNKARLQNPHQLDDLLQPLQKLPNVRFEVHGYADTSGTSPANWRISSQRALNILAEMRNRGFGDDRLTMTAHGGWPTSGGELPDPTTQRRVEIRILPSTAKAVLVLNTSH